MSELITGIHHITAVSGDAQENIDFYAGVLGLRLAKKTVNFDNPEVYHFYFGDTAGHPGTLITTFPYGKSVAQGRHGKGKISTTAFSVPLQSIDYWLKRLDHFRISYKRPQERFGGLEVAVYLEDPDGLGLELIFNDQDQRTGYTHGPVPAEYAIQGIHHAELWLNTYEQTAALLSTHMDHQLIRESASRFRFGVSDIPGKYVDLLCVPDTANGLSGRGMVHHIAFETPDSSTQQQIIQKLDAIGLQHTPVKDRKYFQSVYFNEPGGIIFEIATASPGFIIDEDIKTLGQSLMLPEQYENKRSHLNQTLPEFHFDTEKFRTKK